MSSSQMLESWDLRELDGHLRSHLKYIFYLMKDSFCNSPAYLALPPFIYLSSMGPAALQVFGFWCDFIGLFLWAFIWIFWFPFYLGIWKATAVFPVLC